ncbi:hypothetical protein PHYSODRAFT_406977, partial [Phytophthora sojae]
DPELARLSCEQRRLCLAIYNDRALDVDDLRRRRNHVLHKIRERSRHLARTFIDEKLTAIDRSSHLARMFEATRVLLRQRSPLTSRCDSTARAQRFKERFRILGIDLSRAFDTINRDKLLLVLESIVSSDELRLIRLLLQDTKLALRFGNDLLSPFESNTGTPQ